MWGVDIVGRGDCVGRVHSVGSGVGRVDIVGRGDGVGRVNSVVWGEMAV